MTKKKSKTTGIILNKNGKMLSEDTHIIVHGHMSADTWTKSLIITLPKKGNLQHCSNYRTISLISHVSKVMLEIIKNGFQLQADYIIAEE